MNNVPCVEYIIFGLVWVVSVASAYWITKRKYESKDVVAKDIIPEVLVVPAPRLETPIRAVVADNLNHWKLEVNGNAKFDIKVEWSDGDEMIFSGQAPEVYKMDNEKGVIPMNTAGIPPEWADDGISYQWHLNDNLWC